MGAGLMCPVSQSKEMRQTGSPVSPPLKSRGIVFLLSGHGGKARLAISTKSADLEDGPRQMMARLILSDLVN